MGKAIFAWFEARVSRYACHPSHNYL
jgi:hypothetical protein